MIIDSSALLAILHREPEAEEFMRTIDGASHRLMSATSFLETGMIAVSNRGRAGARELDAFISAVNIEIVPFDHAQALLARDAFARYGRGRHPAKPNFGDCMSYALAKAEGLPLLYKGRDFALTDVMPAVRPSAD